VHRPQLLSDEQRLSPERVARLIVAAGRPAQAFASADEIARHLAGHTRAGDLVLVMSNGSFDGLCERLLEHLRQREEKS
jgi:UDP-N-acetylmuramate: L-alanyl-gamma-D-glutamyl-meso-diaminopimelate ligase